MTTQDLINELLELIKNNPDAAQATIEIEGADDAQPVVRFVNGTVLL